MPIFFKFEIQYPANYSLEDQLAVVAVSCNLEFPRFAGLKQLAQSLADKVGFVRVNKLVSIVLLPGRDAKCHRYDRYICV